LGYDEITSKVLKSYAPVISYCSIMGLNQVVFMQSTNTINKNHSPGYTKEVISMSQRHKERLVLKLLNNETSLLHKILEDVEEEIKQ